MLKSVYFNSKFLFSQVLSKKIEHLVGKVY